MEEYGTTRTPDSRALIVTGIAQNVIGVIFAPKLFMARGKGQFHLAVIAWMVRRVAPAIFRLQGLGRLQTTYAVGSEKKFGNLPLAARAFAITFALAENPARSSQETGKLQIA